MSKNPNYNGFQSFVVPYEPNSYFLPGSGKKCCPAPVADINAVNPRQTIANSQNVIEDLMRPKNEAWQFNFLPIYNQPTKEVFNLNTETPRRSKDIKLR